jgi:predicted nucleic acid-binding protein
MLLDSNILIYAINESSPKHELAQHFLQANRSRLVISHQNITEVLRVLTHPIYPNPMTPIQALESIKAIASKATVIYPTSNTEQLFYSLIKKYQIKGDQTFDTNLVATALTHEVRSIVTDNFNVEIELINNLFSDEKS